MTAAVGVGDAGANENVCAAAEAGVDAAVGVDVEFSSEGVETTAPDDNVAAGASAAA